MGRGLPFAVEPGAGTSTTEQENIEESFEPRVQDDEQQQDQPAKQQEAEKVIN